MLDRSVTTDCGPDVASTTGGAVGTEKQSTESEHARLPISRQLAG